MFPQSPRERSRTPDKDSAVPVVISGSHKLFRPLVVWLLSEAFYSEQLRLDFFSGFNVAITGFCTRRLHAHHHNMVFMRGKINGTLQHLAEFLFVGNHMVCREHADNRVRSD